MRTLWNRVMEPASWLVPSGTSFLIIGISWALISQSIVGILDPLNDLLSLDNSDTHIKDPAVLRIYYLLFGHPWFALGSGLIWGCVFALWNRRFTLRHIDTEIDRNCLRAQGHPWLALRLRRTPDWIGLGVLLIPWPLAYWSGLSVKSFAYGMACTALLIGFPLARRLHSDTVIRLHKTPLEEVMRRRADRWIRNQRIASVVASISSIVVAALFAILSIRFSMDVREASADTRALLSDLDSRGILPPFKPRSNLDDAR